MSIQALTPSVGLSNKAKGKQPVRVQSFVNSAQRAGSTSDLDSDASSDSDDEEESSSFSSSSSVDDAEGLSVFDHLEDLVVAASSSIRARKQARQQAEREAFEKGQDMVSLVQPARSEAAASTGQSSKSKGKARQINQGGSSRGPCRANDGKVIDSSIERLGSGQLLQQDAAPTGRYAKRERRDERSKTAGSAWFNMPAFPTSSTSSLTNTSSSAIVRDEPSRLTRGGTSAISGDARAKTALEMRREIMAIRLRNMMDPKRFYRGSKTGKIQMPEFAQLGTIVSSPFEPKQQLRRDERGRTVVEELIKDAEAAAYAKKKFGELQGRNVPGGRVHHKHKKGKGKGKSKSGRR
ncbi:hypothetical protein K437DRAFT_282566 [Tilletiaria anomala UBC 951]|uniref:Fcf2 pre-rRNA processing C-terminal domain-containing protein n=1 Tax=Tilletiaria anomala (strain ATCC 24038 / CBS 436.72 / UBC 951) TaxID=1037660 RepID=A0A066WC66_TILAU|nr:uncharacterized protein K437DRAFT_282566 [Tilletiaria anomala UBC 951]KDN51326.1 hypothetical protein K437DRAFT_282566 [Tilletiaria anomala UBC 951]